MSKEIRKNRVEFVRYLYSLPEPDRSKRTTTFDPLECECLCVKGHAMLKFGNKYPFYKKVLSALNMTKPQWEEMEARYEGYTFKGYHRNTTQFSFKQIASWLQTLPGWPRVL